MILFDAAPSPYTIGGLDKLVCSEMEWSNILALTKSQNFSGELTQGTLSIKSAFGGEETYIVGDKRYRVREDRLLILNCGEYYSSRTEPEREVESFCLFFHPRFVDQGVRASVSSPELLLENPFDNENCSLHFPDPITGYDSILADRLHNLRHRLLSPNSSFSQEELGEAFHSLLEGLLLTHQDILRKINHIKRVRRTTQSELFRRVARGREFIEDNLSSPIRLNDIAKAAFLSPYYFLRLFRQVYGETPHQYLTRRRMERASHLLATTSESIMAICFEVGFDSPSTFSLLFRRYRGVSPQMFRQRIQQKGN